MAEKTDAMEILLDEFRNDPKFMALAEIVKVMENLDEANRHQVMKDLNSRYAPPKRKYTKRSE